MLHVVGNYTPVASLLGVFFGIAPRHGYFTPHRVLIVEVVSVQVRFLTRQPLAVGDVMAAYLFFTMNTTGSCGVVFFCRYCVLFFFGC